MPILGCPTTETSRHETLEENTKFIGKRATPFMINCEKNLELNLKERLNDTLKDILKEGLE